MKKIMLFLTLLLIATASFAQKDSLSNAVKTRSEAIGHNGNNEIKVNLLYLILGLPELSYERLISDNMGLGLSATFAIEDDQDLNHAFLAYYRLYFGEKKANGFFLEGNTGLIVEERYYYLSYSDVDGYSQSVNRNKAFFGLGAAAGVKFLTRHGLLGEAYLGAGRLLDKSYTELYPRIGFTIGKRF